MPQFLKIIGIIYGVLSLVYFIIADSIMLSEQTYRTAMDLHNTYLIVSVLLICTSAILSALNKMTRANCER